MKADTTFKEQPIIAVSTSPPYIEDNFVSF